MQDVDNPYPWPLFSSYPPPKDYLPVEQIPKMTAFEEGTLGKIFMFFKAKLLKHITMGYLKDCFPFTVQETMANLSVIVAR